MSEMMSSITGHEVRPPLEDWLVAASEQKAESLLVLVGRSPVIRVDGQLRPPLSDHRITFQQTELLAKELVPAEKVGELNDSGNAEFSFDVAGIKGRVSVFFGLGCHNLVFHLDGEATEL